MNSLRIWNALFIIAAASVVKGLYINPEKLVEMPGFVNEVQSSQKIDLDVCVSLWSDTKWLNQGVLIDSSWILTTNVKGIQKALIKGQEYQVVEQVEQPNWNPFIVHGKAFWANRWISDFSKRAGSI